jgi:hypothetical protein
MFRGETLLRKYFVNTLSNKKKASLTTLHDLYIRAHMNKHSDILCLFTAFREPCGH